MSDPYILILFVLAILAVSDLVIGVSNDAINFLNSAVGSKVISLRNILIIASLGVFLGAVTSSGMMEVARKGIFNPGMFTFQDVMIIFLAVMITDIILLDIFNSIAIPTSTTVSVIFELLGASIAISLIKITKNNTEDFSAIWNYINYNTALDIIIGIVLSVVVAFSIGAIVQYFSRLLYSFDIENRPTYINVIFGGISITAITYFIIIKGLKGTDFYGSISDVLNENLILIVLLSFIFWLLFSYLFIKVAKKNILILIVGFGTFSLAVAFAGNDLVNFIGVPIAGLNSYELWRTSGVDADQFLMSSLANKVPSNTWLLLLAGAIMVITIWTSSKARSVIETGVNLSRQGEGHEKFQPNNLSRIVVRFSIFINEGFRYIIPNKTLARINSKFEIPVVNLHNIKNTEMPAFDLVRASVNLVMASVLISIATSLKLPLSTTYVSFMVAMGTSFADRAWGRESAVYRVAGVLNVIGGWFLTAIVAATAAGIVAYFINLHMAFIIVFLLTAAFLIIRSTVLHRKKIKEQKRLIKIERSELRTINAVIEESADHISEVALRIEKLYTSVVTDLAKHDLKKLKNTDKFVLKLTDEIDDLKDNVFYFIKSLDENSLQASKFYIMVLGFLQDAAQSISFISRASYKHVNNNHKNLKKGQIKDLKEINNQLSTILQNVSDVFKNRNFDNLHDIIRDKNLLLGEVSDSVEKQVNRIRTDETSPKNTTLYFSILLETKDLIKALMSLLETYEEFYLSTRKINI